MTRDRCMNADKVEKILGEYGFQLISQKGSHRNSNSWVGLQRARAHNSMPYFAKIRLGFVKTNC